MPMKKKKMLPCNPCNEIAKPTRNTFQKMFMIPRFSLTAILRDRSDIAGILQDCHILKYKI
jgi:hypothetical protein